MVQIVSGYPAIYDNIRRWSRTSLVRGALDDDTVADAVNTAKNQVFDICIESGQPWSMRNETVDDSSLGTEVEANTYRYFLETDLGITDLVRVRRIWRVPADPTQSTGVRLRHIDQIGPRNEDNWLFGDECWTEDGDYNDAGTHERTIIVYNKGNALEGGLLKINYWFMPPDITSAAFTDEDANGDRTTAPPLPRKVWDAITDYAKLVLLETSGDDFKKNALWTRYHGPSGVLERLRTNLAAFQTGDASFVDDSGME